MPEGRVSGRRSETRPFMIQLLCHLSGFGDSLTSVPDRAGHAPGGPGITGAARRAILVPGDHGPVLWHAGHGQAGNPWAFSLETGRFLAGRYVRLEPADIGSTQTRVRPFSGLGPGAPEGGGKARLPAGPGVRGRLARWPMVDWPDGRCAGPGGVVHWRQGATGSNCLSSLNLPPRIRRWGAMDSGRLVFVWTGKRRATATGSASGRQSRGQSCCPVRG